MIDVDRALLRGQYAACVAVMAAIGVSIDVPFLYTFMASLPVLRERIAARADVRYPGCFDGPSFMEDGFAELLKWLGLWWPPRSDGKPKLDYETLDEMCDYHPWLRFLRDVRWMLRQVSRLKLADYVGEDGRSHVMSVPFSAKTGRDGHSTSKSFLAAPAFMRSFIQAPAGCAHIYADFKAEEYGLMAFLAQCKGMLAAYELARHGKGDVYFEFGKDAGMVPRDAQREDHENLREVLKTTVLATGYGQGPVSLGRRLRTQSDYAGSILSQFERAYPEWSVFANRVWVTSQFRKRMRAPLGWKMWVTPLTDEHLSLKNWPIQACAAEILKVAVVLAFQRALRVVGALHDALLVECRIEDLARTETVVREVMVEASRIVLRSYELAVDCKVFVYPERFHDKRGDETWAEIRDVMGWSL